VCEKLSESFLFSNLAWEKNSDRVREGFVEAEWVSCQLFQERESALALGNAELRKVIENLLIMRFTENCFLISHIVRK
jgi:hypothetical protein